MVMLRNMLVVLCFRYRLGFRPILRYFELMLSQDRSLLCRHLFEWVFLLQMPRIIPDIPGTLSSVNKEAYWGGCSLLDLFMVDKRMCVVLWHDLTHSRHHLDIYESSYSKTFSSTKLWVRWAGKLAALPYAWCKWLEHVSDVIPRNICWVDEVRQHHCQIYGDNVLLLIIDSQNTRILWKAAELWTNYIGHAYW